MKYKYALIKFMQLPSKAAFPTKNERLTLGVVGVVFFYENYVKNGRRTKEIRKDYENNEKYPFVMNPDWFPKGAKSLVCNYLTMLSSTS